MSFPDKDQYNNWLNVTIELNVVDFKISVRDFIEIKIFKTVLIWQTII